MSNLGRLAVALNSAGEKYHPKHEWRIYGETIRLVAKDGSYLDGAINKKVGDKISRALHISGITYDDFKDKYPQTAKTSFMLDKESVINGKMLIPCIKQIEDRNDDIVDIGLNYSAELKKAFNIHSPLNELKAVLGKGYYSREQ